MSKIVEAINSMIKNSHLIQEVSVLSDYYSGNNIQKYFFRYKSYVWSIQDKESDGSDFELIFYPGYNVVSDVLSDIRHPGLNEDEYVKYTSSDIKTREATESFADLYRVVKGKLHNVDSVLEDIIGDM